jgi:hypothetical protein
LAKRSFIKQVKYSPKRQSVAIVGTNDGNVQFGFNLGTGVANQANWVNVVIRAQGPSRAPALNFSGLLGLRLISGQQFRLQAIHPSHLKLRFNGLCERECLLVICARFSRPLHFREDVSH